MYSGVGTGVLQVAITGAPGHTNSWVDYWLVLLLHFWILFHIYIYIVENKCCEKRNASTPLGIAPRIFRLSVEWFGKISKNSSWYIYIVCLEIFFQLCKGGGGLPPRPCKVKLRHWLHTFWKFGSFYSCKLNTSDSKIVKCKFDIYLIV